MFSYTDQPCLLLILGIVTETPAPKCWDVSPDGHPQREALSVFACLSPCMSVWFPHRNRRRTRQRLDAGSLGQRAAWPLTALPLCPKETLARSSSHRMAGWEPPAATPLSAGRAIPRTGFSNWASSPTGQLAIPTCRGDKDAMLPATGRSCPARYRVFLDGFPGCGNHQQTGEPSGFALGSLNQHAVGRQ